MKIAIGSKNPVKVAAVTDGLKEAFPKAEFVSVDVKSGVSSQPVGDDETVKGATNRATEALKKIGADLGVGLEGGVEETKHGMMATVWCAIIDVKGNIGLGGGLHIHIPEVVAKKIRNGVELGKAMDELTNRKDTKHQEGALGILTKGLIDRKTGYESLVRLAAAKFLNPDLYSR
ncbi:MAG: inosine/xanthosine triphosphatase [Candidatus Aenigmarchaeota archaeon]|nr:inosine/xanthosine triphosphatase [Candidatus Aenigmarchaeota archaeon]